MTDVLIGQSYFLRFDPKLWAAQQPYAPLGALYAAACARAAGYDVSLFDAMLATSVDEWTAALDRHRPRLAVLFEDNFNYLSKMCLLRMRTAAQAMVGVAASRDIPVIVCGSDASDHPALYLSRGARAVIRGEGETTLVELLDVLTGRSADRLEAIAGVATLGPDGSVVLSPARGFIRDLDALPRPAWDLVDVERYRQIWRRRHGYFSMNVATTRGCPYHCNWCAKPIYGQRYTARSPESVADEIAWLKRAYRPDHLWITDDIFGLKPGWLDRFAARIRELDAVVPFRCLLRADQVTAEAAAALRVAGCRTAWIGAESGSQRVLDLMEKGTRVEHIDGAARLLRDAGIEVGFFLQFGYPGEGRADIDRTLDMVRRCAPDDIGISVSYPLPGTPFHERVREDLGETRNWTDSDDLAVMYRAAFPAEFYRVLHRLVHAEFRARRAWSAWRRTPSRGLFQALDAVRYLATVPWYRFRLNRAAEGTTVAPPPRRLALLTPEAAAVPSEQQP